VNKFVGAICEFGSIYESNSDRQVSLSQLELSKENFKLLTTYLESNSSESELDRVFEITLKRGKRVVKVKNYVGFIQVNSNLIIEILPKLFRTETWNSSVLQDSRRTLMRMLRVVQDTSYIDFNNVDSSVDSNATIFEIFFAHYLQLVHNLTIKGLKFDYVETQASTIFIRGRLLIPETIRLSSIGKPQHICEFDNFTHNLSGNRIIKQTLDLLFRISINTKHQNMARKLMQPFAEVGEMGNLETELAESRIKFNSSEDYLTIIQWSEIFLRGTMFDNSHGKNSGISLLFPMNKLFESYIGALLVKILPNKVLLKDRRNYFAKIHSDNMLGNHQVNYVRLEPDIVIQEPLIILDTKWKLLNPQHLMSEVEESDLYQLFAYGKTYQNPRSELDIPLLVLIYPQTDVAGEKIVRVSLGDSIDLYVTTFDLNNPDIVMEVNDLFSRISISKKVK